MDYLEIIGTLVGLLYLWFEYKASIWLWAAGIVMPALSLMVYYRFGLCGFRY
jgi:nicotinamide mononucleotide transporter